MAVLLGILWTSMWLPRSRSERWAGIPEPPHKDKREMPVVTPAMQIKRKGSLLPQWAERTKPNTLDCFPTQRNSKIHTNDLHVHLLLEKRMVASRPRQPKAVVILYTYMFQLAPTETCEVQL